MEFNFSHNLIENRDRKRQGALYVQVEPKIRIGAQKTVRELPLDSIRCQTVMAKCLGPLSTWESKLLVAKNSGYNLLHFTPIQVCFDELMRIMAISNSIGIPFNSGTGSISIRLFATKSIKSQSRFR